ncbi:hypothetical protein H7U19_08860 [Hyunsoonleella sp. SJ7]|uniref:Uncharacterized protein n=1 Tax=Hyunsoonleella aquatilis TaxID=2762758 RepID=A0A923KKH6_9FLAO|nr:hypothetical protein [Hyunsoonleella aquatilis]MBC3758512.1 hypothetical protein [Hyunsoonleella aquatilis]
MKNLIFTLALVFIAVGAFAQQRKDLKGPAYKNYKPWQHKAEPATAYTVSNHTQLKGPAYKNYKPWQNDSEKKYTQVASNSERMKLRGPAFKNYKPWQKESEDGNTKVAKYRKNKASDKVVVND